ncbi:hypothetical protein [Roseivivax halotolerans]|uniref:hypothetical protein n=1 Tax=Roseivivax halotolerans TaxID=93684 RepID=UPI001113F54A|nr:hypothetical protein [Roseivivax halotolerans]
MADNVFEANTTFSSGSTITTSYGTINQEVVPVTKDQLIEMKESSVEEFWQFAVAEFVVAGALWLAIEKLLDRSEGEPLSPIFWVCLVAVALGAVVGWAGFRQLQRRKTKIDKILESFDSEKS